jgi:predicted nucleic acid-binding protein
MHLERNFNRGRDSPSLAATALANAFAVATRNTKHFEPMGVAVINPWVK